MTTFRNFARRCFRRTQGVAARTPPRQPAGRRRYELAILIALLSCWSAGCARRVTYVNADRKLIRLEAGQSAPHAGVLMSEGYLSEIYEALGRK